MSDFHVRLFDALEKSDFIAMELKGTMYYIPISRKEIVQEQPRVYQLTFYLEENNRLMFLGESFHVRDQDIKISQNNGQAFVEDIFGHSRKLFFFTQRPLSPDDI